MLANLHCIVVLFGRQVIKMLAFIVLLSCLVARSSRCSPSLYCCLVWSPGDQYDGLHCIVVLFGRQVIKMLAVIVSLSCLVAR